LWSYNDDWNLLSSSSSSWPFQTWEINQAVFLFHLLFYYNNNNKKVVLAKRERVESTGALRTSKTSSVLNPWCGGINGIAVLLGMTFLLYSYPCKNWGLSGVNGYSGNKTTNGRAKTATHVSDREWSKFCTVRVSVCMYVCVAPRACVRLLLSFVRFMHHYHSLPCQASLRQVSRPPPSSSSSSCSSFGELHSTL
jgi:hypothetical protein